MVYHKYKASIVSDTTTPPSSTTLLSNNHKSSFIHRHQHPNHHHHHRRRIISVTRNHIPHKSSPYVGWFRHAPAISSSSREIRRYRRSSHLDIVQQQSWNYANWRSCSSLPTALNQGKSSPYIGWFRHAPRSNLYETKVTTTATTVEDGFHYGMSRDDSCPDTFSKLETIPNKQTVSGRLPGGSPTHDTDTIRPIPINESAPTRLAPAASSYSHFSSPRKGYSKPELELSSGVFTKFATWFLFPLIASDEKTSFLTKHNLGEDAMAKGMANGVVLLLPYLSSAFKRFFLVEDGTTKLHLRGAVGGARNTTHPPQQPRDDGSETDVSEYSDYDSPYVPTYSPANCDDQSYNTNDHDDDNDTIKKDLKIDSTTNTTTLPIEDEIRPLHVSVSSLAQAYYAEHARQVIVDQYPEASNPLASLRLEEDQPNQCLDYSISQIDITRMARNASRHLDVESILKLPSITYKTPTTMTERLQHTTTTGDDVSSSLSCVDTMSQQQQQAETTTASSINEQNTTSETTTNSAPNTMEEEDAELGWSWVSTPENPEGTRILTNTNPDTDTERTVETDAKEEQAEVVVQQQQVAQEEEKCIICLEEFADGDRLRVLPCDHLFHMGCIDKWLSGTFSHHECFTSGCPTCKKTPTIIDSEVDAGDTESVLEASANNDSVPSWAFANLGGSLAMQI